MNEERLVETKRALPQLRGEYANGFAAPLLDELEGLIDQLISRQQANAARSKALRAPTFDLSITGLDDLLSALSSIAPNEIPATLSFLKDLKGKGGQSEDLTPGTVLLGIAQSLMARAQNEGVELEETASKSVPLAARLRSADENVRQRLGISVADWRKYN